MPKPGTTRGAEGAEWKRVSPKQSRSGGRGDGDVGREVDRPGAGFSMLMAEQ